MGGYGWGCIPNIIGLFLFSRLKLWRRRLQCHYCAFNGCFETVANNSFCIHKDEPLKCRQLVLESSTGKFKNQTKQYGFLKKSKTIIIFRGGGGGGGGKESDLQTSTSPRIHN